VLRVPGSSGGDLQVASAESVSSGHCGRRRGKGHSSVGRPGLPIAVQSRGRRPRDKTM